MIPPNTIPDWLLKPLLGLAAFVIFAVGVWLYGSYQYHQGVLETDQKWKLVAAKEQTRQDTVVKAVEQDQKVAIQEVEATRKQLQDKQKEAVDVAHILEAQRPSVTCGRSLDGLPSGLVQQLNAIR